ncbi:MAG: hypothetical protein EHM17_01820 [Verrucomicrobiaceae bacterium]|nr:MAG: hypothetical protein EHM17_01820 [Verrucomicrobiaceae bacterium]
MSRKIAEEVLPRLWQRCAGRGRPPTYGEPEADVLWTIWKAAEQPCGKRLESIVPPAGLVVLSWAE